MAQRLREGTVHIEHLRFSTTFRGVFSMTFQDLVWRVEVEFRARALCSLLGDNPKQDLFFNTVNATFAAHCSRTLNKLLLFCI